jgi:hypothetical protein
MSKDNTWVQVPAVDMAYERSALRPGGQLLLGRKPGYGGSEFTGTVQALTPEMHGELRGAHCACPNTMQHVELVQVRERRREMVLVLRGRDTTTNRQYIFWRRIPKWLGRKILGMSVAPAPSFQARQRQSCEQLGRTMEQLSRELQTGSRVIRRRRRVHLG